MMISDEERRRVAHNLRSSRYILKPAPSGKQFMSMIRAAGELELAHEMNYLTKSGFERLADLVDRPTCRIVHDKNRDCDVCTNCSTSFELAEFDYADVYACEGYSYCPKCGAEVVS